jgi:hypothetical protein
VLLVAAVAVVLARVSVYEQFEPYRAKLVEESLKDVSGRASFTFAAPVSPVALILRAASQPAGPAHVTVDDIEVCAPELGAVVRRIDCAIESLAGADSHHVAIRASGALTIDALEVATHYGNVTVPNILFVVPRQAPYAPVSWMWTLVLALSAAAVAAAPIVPVRRGLRLVMGVLQVGAGVLVLATIAAPWVSPFKILLSEGTAVRWLCLLWLPHLVAAARWLWHRGPVSPRVDLARAVVTGAIVALVFGIFARAELDRFHGNYSGFLKIERAKFEQNPLINTNQELRDSLWLYETGYDGEFMYMMAFDPWLRQLPNVNGYSAVVDTPPYRYGRIGFTLLTRLVTFGHWRAFPAAMVWLLLTALGASAAAVAWIAARSQRSPAMGLLILVIPGFWSSLHNGLPEPLAAALLLTAFACLFSGRAVVAGVLCALSLLVRETGMFAVLAACAWLALDRRHRDAVVVGLLAFAPIAAWRTYVGLRLSPVWGASAFFYHPPAGAPFAGIAATWTAIRAGAYWPTEPHMATGALTLPVLFVLGGAVALLLAVRRRSVIAIAACVYALSALSLDAANVWVHVGNAERTSFELFVMLLLLTSYGVAGARIEKWWLATFWSACGVYCCWLMLDAVIVRDAIVRVLWFT